MCKCSHSATRCSRPRKNCSGDTGSSPRVVVNSHSRTAAGAVRYATIRSDAVAVGDNSQSTLFLFHRRSDSTIGACANGHTFVPGAAIASAPADRIFWRRVFADPSVAPSRMGNARQRRTRRTRDDLFSPLGNQRRSDVALGCARESQPHAASIPRPDARPAHDAARGGRRRSRPDERCARCVAAAPRVGAARRWRGKRTIPVVMFPASWSQYAAPRSRSAHPTFTRSNATAESHS